MSPDLTPRRANLGSAQHSGGRYAVQIDLRYKVRRQGLVVQRGSGKTLEFSRRELIFSSDQSLPSGSQVELSLDWPVMLGGCCPLQLMIIGRVVRSSRYWSIVRIERHEFRTRRLPPHAAAQTGTGPRVPAIPSTNFSAQ